MQTGFFKKQEKPETTLAELQSLSEVDKADLKEVHDEVASLGDIAIKYKNFPHATIYKFATAKSEFKEEFKKLCEESEVLNADWVSHLETSEYPADFISHQQPDGTMEYSLDCVDPKTRTCSPFSRYLGAYLLTVLGNINDIKPNEFDREKYKILNAACSLGMFQAYSASLELFNKRMIASRDSKADVNQTIDSAKKAANEVANLYWTLGYLLKAETYLSIADYEAYAKLETEQKENFAKATAMPNFFWQSVNHNDLPKYVQTLKVAAEAFYSAKILCNAPTSAKLINVINKGKDVFDGQKFSTWDEGINGIKERLKGLNITNPDGFLVVAEKNAEKTLTQLRPDLGKVVEQDAKALPKNS